MPEKKRSNFKDWTPEQRKMYHAKSCETKKRNTLKKKLMKEQLTALLSTRISSRKVKEKLKNMGIEDEDLNNQMLLLFNVLRQAQSNDKNAVSAATFIRDTLGEKPHDTQVNVETDFESYISSLEADDEF